MLEGHIKRLGCSVSHGQSSGQGWSDSCTGVHKVEDAHEEPAGGAPVSWPARSRSPQQWATPGTLLKRWAPSPSSARLQKAWVTFEEQQHWECIPQWGRFPPQPRLRRHPTEASWWKGTLGPHPLLTPILITSWEGTHAQQEAEGGGTPSEIYSLHLPMRTTASGLSGMVDVWTCQVWWWGVADHPWHRKPSGTCLESEGLFWGAHGMQPSPKRAKMTTLPCWPLSALGKDRFLLHPGTNMDG